MRWGQRRSNPYLVGSVKLDAADDKCLAVANAMNELMSHEVVNVYVTEKAELAQAE